MWFEYSVTDRKIRYLLSRARGPGGAGRGGAGRPAEEPGGMPIDLSLSCGIGKA
ncbi:MAG: hypothetical protein A4E65_03198 [Syntrophorhabdus sp. PtaU1.Bin153]|nr:MAG: hypothetical protein A4E65_03198 [Syntrophorhabdus sp. PtaU1.Bin153]